MLSRLALMVKAAVLGGQFFDPFSLFDDCGVASKVGVGWSYVADALVVALVVVVIDEGADVRHFGHYDEPEILRYAITSIRPKGADVRHLDTISSGLWRLAAIFGPPLSITIGWTNSKGGGSVSMRNFLPSCVRSITKS